MLILDAKTVTRVDDSLSRDQLVDLMRLAFEEFNGAGRSTNAVAPARTVLPSDNHTSLFMPSRIGKAGGTGIKIVSIPGESAERLPEGLPAGTILIDEISGTIRGIVNARHLTGLRNAATSALASRLVGIDSPNHIVFFGAGLQILHHAKMMLVLYSNSLRSCSIINRTLSDRTDNLASLLRIQFPSVQVTVVRLDDSDAVKDALSGADIICTATPSKTPLFEESWVNPNAHLNLIGSYTRDMREAPKGIIDTSSLILVDSIEACAKEAGDLVGISSDRWIELGFFSMMGSKSHERRNPSRTVFKSVGVGVQDVAIADLVLRRAEELGIGTRLEFD